MTDMYSIYNALTDIMCSRCSKEVSEACSHLSEEQRCRNRIYCMKMILESNDEKYPVELPDQTVKRRSPGARKVGGMTTNITDLELVEGRLEGLKLLLETPSDKKTMTNAELKFAIKEVEIIRGCMKITPDTEGEQR